LALLIQKFGGTSVANPEARECMLAKVAEAAKQGNRVVLVVSAMGRKGAPYATDTLLGLLDEAGGGDGLTRDLMASCGETISACLVATLLSARGTKAIPLTAYTAGILAKGPYGDADISSIEVERILSILEKGAVPVITGFQAVNEDHSVITIGRGGSDTSAVAVGAWLKADFVDIYTDVPGVAMADPRIVPEAPFLDRLDYRSMYRLAANGSRVLHDRSALLGERFGVRIRVRSTFDDGEGTLVSAEPLSGNAPQLLGIANNKTETEAIVTVVCRSGASGKVLPTAKKTALSSGAKTAVCADPDAAAFSCPPADAPALVRALFTATGSI
jgi:aspartate kinase